MNTSTPKTGLASVKSKRGGRGARGGNKGIRGGHGRGAPKKGGDNSGRGSGRTISGPSDKGECSGVQTKKACTKPLISDISNDEEDSNVNKSFMNNSSDTESSHSSDFGDLLKPKKRRTHKWLLMFKASLNGVNLLCHFKMSLIVNIAASKQINVNFEIKMGYLVQAAMRSEGRKYYGQWI